MVHGKTELRQYFMKKLFLCVVAFFCIAHAEEKVTPSEEKTIGFFGGVGTADNFSRIIHHRMRYRFNVKAAMAGIGGQYLLVKFTDSIDLRAEGQLIQHFTIQTCQELTLAPMIRVGNVFNTKVPLHFSIGNGVSVLVGAKPHFENQKQKARRTLNYFFVDFATNIGEKEIYFRLHHRCHLLKAIAPKGVGSNYFLIGIRMKLQSFGLE